MADDAELEPARFILTPAEVTAGFVAAGVAPPKLPIYEGLPAYDGALPPAMADARGRLLPALAAIFRILGKADRSLAVDAWRPGLAGAAAARFLGVGPSPPYLALSINEDGDWDLALLTEGDQVLVMASELIGLGLVNCPGGGPPLALSPAALAVLCAFGDLVQEETLTRKLARDMRLPAAPLNPVAAGDLLPMLEAGLDSADTRWGVALAAALGSGELEQQRSLEALEAGLNELAGAGLADEDGLMMAEGLALAHAFAAPEAAAAIVTAQLANGRRRIDHLVAWRLPESLLVGSWTGAEGSRTLLLSQMSPGGLLRLIEAALAEEPAWDACPACAAPATPGARFCAACGKPLAAA